MQVCLPWVHATKNPRRNYPLGSKYKAWITRGGKGSTMTADQLPDRVSLLHKGDESHMAQRVRIPYRGQGPSSVTQLPILTALHAGFPTLFQITIHETGEIVNNKMDIYR